jgi:hypothetical protein
MAVDSAAHIASLNPLIPTGSDQVAEADNNFRQLKAVLVTDFPNIAGPVTATHTELNYVDGVTSAIQPQIDAKAPIASPTFTGTPAAPTASLGTSTTQLATTGFVQAAIANVNAQVALTLAIDSATSVQLVAGQHTTCTNAATVTATLPAAPVANQRCRVTFTNALYSNVIDPGAEKIFSASGTRTVNALHASPEFTYVNSTIGWVY